MDASLYLYFCSWWVQEFSLTMVNFNPQVAEFQNGIVIEEGRVTLDFGEW